MENEKLKTETDKLQKEMHLFVEYIINERKNKCLEPASYQDCTNVFLLAKLAELKQRIDEIDLRTRGSQQIGKY